MIKLDANLQAVLESLANEFVKACERERDDESFGWYEAEQRRHIDLWREQQKGNVTK